MTTQIISDVAFNDPTNLIPYLEKDDAILRNITKGMVDFSNPSSYAGGALAVGGIVKSLTSDGSNALAGSALPAQAGGLIDFGGASPFLTLPDTFKLPNTVKRFLAIVWAKLPAGGYQTASGNVIQSLFGYANNTSTLCQWGLSVTTVQATGVPVSINAYTPGNGGVAVADNLTDAPSVAAACDGNLHQFAVYFDGESAPGQATRQILIDKVAKRNVSSAWDGSFNVPAASTRLGVLNAFEANVPAGFKLGRPSMWDLTGTPWTPAQILQRDWDAAQGFIL